MVRYSRLTSLALWVTPLAFIAVLFYLPLAKIGSIGLTANFLAELVEPKTLEAIWFTIWQALLSTLLCLVLGIPGAYVLYRREFIGRKLLRAIITVPMVLPGIIVAVIFTNQRSFHFEPLASNAHYWIIAAHVFINYSIAVRAIGSVWLSLDPETEEAAELAGAGRLRTLIAISLPQLKPALVSAAALIFLYCSASFGIILVLGNGLVNSIETEIALAATQFLDLERASALAIFQTLLTVAAFVFSEKISHGAASFETESETAPKQKLDLRDLPATAITLAISVGLIAIPIATLLVQAFMVDGQFSLQNFANLSGQGERELLNISVVAAATNTLRNLIISASLAIGLGLLISYLLSRQTSKSVVDQRRWWQGLLDVLFLLPVGISSVVLGFGYLITFGSGLLPIRDSWVVVPLVQALMAIPLVIRIVYPALVAIGKEAREAAAIDGATPRQTWWLVESKMVRSVIGTAISYTVVASIGEFGAAQLLAYGNQATLPTVLYALISRPGGQNYGMALAITALIILLSLILILIASGSSPRRRRAA